MLVLATSLEKGKKLAGAVIRELNGDELKLDFECSMAFRCAEKTTEGTKGLLK
jgi:hypothetical protein